MTTIVVTRPRIIGIQVRRTMAIGETPAGDGVELLGYTMWGILDIVSCGPLTMDKRYGVVYVDLDNGGKGTGKRIRKDSFYWYKKCIESNGEDLA